MELKLSLVCRNNLQKLNKYCEKEIQRDMNGNDNDNDNDSDYNSAIPHI